MKGRKINQILSFILIQFLIFTFPPNARALDIPGDLTTGIILDPSLGSIRTSLGIEYTVSGPLPCQSPESIAYAFDGIPSTKFCSGSWSDNVLSSIVLTFKNANVNISGIKIKTANDSTYYSERNPISWILSGSNDGVTWIPLKSNTYDFSLVSSLGNYSDYPDVSVSHANSYSKIRFHVTRKLDNFNSEIQFSELVFIGTVSNILCEFKGNSGYERNPSKQNNSSSLANSRSQGSGACQNALSRK